MSGTPEAQGLDRAVERSPAGRLDAVLELLACPHCGGGLTRAGGSVRCGRGHAFDLARQGYVNLSRARRVAGDSAAMVAARERFLAGGHLGWLAEALGAEAARALAAGPPGCVVDVGAGTGWHLARVLERLPGRTGVALDVSRYALRRAARAHPRAAAVGCDVWQGLPLRDRAAALALSVFAPRNGAELARVLHPRGAALVAAPTARHLVELVAALDLLTVDARKSERVTAALGPRFVAVAEAVHERMLTLAHADLLALASMGPSAWHQDQGLLRRRVGELPEPMAVTASMTLSTFQER